MSCRGQSTLELAICLPLLVALALGAVALVRLADARSGLDAATAAAAEAAARAPDPDSATSAAEARFAAVIAAYPVAAPRLTVEAGNQPRGGLLTARGQGRVELGFAPLPGLPRSLLVAATAHARIQRWRTR